MCELDPRLPDFYVDRRETSRVMMTLGTDTTLNSLPVSKQPTKRRRSINMHDEDTGPVISSSKLPSAVKRTKRKGADALLLADAEGDLVVLPDVDDDVGGGSTRSSRSRSCRSRSSSQMSV